MYAAFVFTKWIHDEVNLSLFNNSARLLRKPFSRLSAEDQKTLETAIFDLFPMYFFYPVRETVL